MQQYRISRLDFWQINDRRVDRYRLFLRNDQSPQLRYRLFPLLDQLVQAGPPDILAGPFERGRQRACSRNLRHRRKLARCRSSVLTVQTRSGEAGGTRQRG